MALYTIADLHLSTGADKPMDVFGGAWDGYMDKIRREFKILAPGDTLVIPGDFSWAMNLPEALGDFRFVRDFPGRIILAKGNHDLWWDTVSKMRGFLDNNGIAGIEFLHNNSFMYGDAAICGTRGWFYEEESGGAHDEKMMRREAGRLKMSLDAAKNAGASRIYCFMHYPPIYGDYECPEVTSLLEEYGVAVCYYGHLHSAALRRAFRGDRRGVIYKPVSADYLDFKPLLVME